MVFILLLFLSAALNAQFYEAGQDAGSLRWRQYRTPHYRVIFPVGTDSVANVFAQKLEKFYPYLGENLDHRHQAMPVIVHNESSFSNGVFVWAPKRLEIYSNPDPNGYNQDWLTQLALHEGRHAVQIDKLNQGFTKGLYFLGGEQLVGAMAIFLPYWYLEGDAVDNETRLSLGGRGRLPSFEKGLKAQLLEGDGLYSFSKATMGSYRDFIPNHYELGYFMVRYGRRTYGDKLWIDFQDRVARRPFLLNPTYFAMRDHGLKSKKHFYRETLSFYRDHWAKQDSMRIRTDFNIRSTGRSKHYTSYQFPAMNSGKNLVAYKSGLDQIPEFISIDRDGKEKRLFRPGFLSSASFSASDELLVWDEFVPDTRWSNRNFSVIRSYNRSTGEVRNLGRRTRYYAPALSRDASRIATIEQSEFQEFSLVILDLDGRILQKIPSPENHYMQYPSWAEGDSAIILVRAEGTVKSLVSYHLEKDHWIRMFEAGDEDISNPVQKGDRIFFSATFSGIDNIYCFHRGVQEVFQLTSSRFGARQPSVSDDGESLFYADYGSEGYNIAEMKISEGLWKPLDENRSHEEQVDYAPSSREREIMLEVEQSDSSSFTSTPYRKFLHLFNLHSWLPLYFNYLDPDLDFNPEQLPVSPGFSLISQNHLSTAVSQLAYEYRDGYHLFHSGIKLKGRYPVLNLSFDYGGHPDILMLNEAGDSAMALPRDLRVTAESYVPLRLNTGKFLSLIQPGITYEFSRDVQYIKEKQAYRSGTHYMKYSLYATSYLRKGARDIWPRLGMTLNGGYYHSPFDSRHFGATAYGSFYAYLPGVLKHQSLRLSYHRQKQYPLDIMRPVFVNLIRMPRGYTRIFGEELRLYSADYMFPVIYPDIGSMIYLKRIRGTLWADHMEGRNVIVWEPNPHYEDRDYTTIGADLWFDMNIFRITFPLSLGARIIYEPSSGIFQPDLLFAIDIN